MNWTMKKTVENDRNGIWCNFTTYSKDIDFADDLALLSSKKHIQDKANRQNKYSKEIGMKTSIKKTKLVRYINAKDQTPILIDGKM